MFVYVCLRGDVLVSTYTVYILQHKHSLSNPCFAVLKISTAFIFLVLLCVNVCTV